jgi:membrane-bound lytic murein transglycosylase A
MKFLFLNLILIIVFLTGCLDKKVEKFEHISNANLEKTTFKNLKGFYNDNLNLALEVFQKDCKARRVNKNLKDICKESFSYTSGKEFFTKNFTPYKLLNKKNTSKGLITGYYEPIIKGSFTQSDIYKYPVYKTPKNLITVRLSSLYPELKKYTLRGKVVGNKLVPYDTRAELQKNTKHLEPLLYLTSKTDKFFLEIQGSGKVELPDGKIINLAYSNQNGRKYYPIGRKLIKDGEVKKEDMSLQAIKKWCEKNPDKIDELFNLNQSTVFFYISKRNATGSLGVELVAKRNIAVDRSFIPLGFPVFLNTTNPISKEAINSLVVAADTGGAIKGDVRADFFWGNGDEAELGAGKMAEAGELTVLIPNNSIAKKGFLGDIPNDFKMKSFKN